MNIIFSIYKPQDLTSFSIVKEVRKHLYKTKVGHAGTLDPFATGVLVVCTGSKTKQSSNLMSFEKEYLAEIKLGERTDTLDPTGKVIEVSKVPNIKLSNIEQVLESYIGTIEQIPPMFSAIKINGERLYKKARKGIVVDRKARMIEIYKIDILEFKDNIIKIRVTTLQWNH